MKTLTILLALLAVMFAASPALAYLGSFEPADGYTITAIPGSPGSPYIDVSYYNAGQFGANAGGGSATPIAPDSGLWDLKSEAGGYYATSAARNADTGTAPPYPASFSAINAYIIGNHSPGHTGNGALAVRNDAGAIGAMEYDYTIDTYDFGGLTPSLVTSGVVSTGFYFCPNPSEPPNPGGASPEKFIMSFKDQSGNIGLQLGYARDNEVYWRADSSGSWNYTGVIADSTNWDAFTVNIDLTANTFGIDYFDVSTSLTSTLAPAGTALGAGMQNLTNLDWWLDQQVSGGVGGKNFFDDFSFQTTVPEPSSAMLLLGGGALVCLRRRRKPTSR